MQPSSALIRREAVCCKQGVLLSECHQHAAVTTSKHTLNWIFLLLWANVPAWSIWYDVPINWHFFKLDNTSKWWGQKVWLWDRLLWRWVSTVVLLWTLLVDFAGGLWWFEDPQDPTSVKSRTAYVLCLADSPIIWASKVRSDNAQSKQITVHCCLQHLSPPP